MIEKIICAATWFDDGKVYRLQPKNIKSGLVVMGFNHAQIYATIGGSVKERHDLGLYEKESGFVTTHQRFVDRKEGLAIAMNANQIVEKHGSANLLFSEDLFDYGDISIQQKSET